MNGTTTAPNPYLPLVARILMGVLFIIFGVRKVLGFAGTVGYFTHLGFPAAEVMTVLSIVIEVGGGILLVVGWKTRWAGWLLALFTVIAMLMAHRYWQADATQYANQMTHFFKNVAIVGGLLMMAAFGPGPLSVDKS